MPPARTGGRALASRRGIHTINPMSTVIEIESAVEKLNPQESRAFAVWYEQRQSLLNAAEATFLAYDEEEGKSA